MSNIEVTENTEDLIDFLENSPVFQETSSSCITWNEDDRSDNLLDSELPELEQKLQTSNSFTLRPIITSNAIDVEDILISLDDDDDDVDEVDNKTFYENRALYRSNSEELLNPHVAERSNLERSLSFNDLEVLTILNSLDEVLNAQLTDSDEHSECETNRNANNDTTDERTQQCIEDCLQDLDNYLKELDSVYDNTELECDDERQHQLLTPGDDNLKFSNGVSSELNEEELRKKLRQIEENYAKFISSVCTNNNSVDSVGVENESRSLSAAFCKRNRFLRKYYPNLYATVAGARRSRHRILYKSHPKPHNDRRTADRTSGAAPGADSLRHDDVQQARRAHASTDCCTGTVVVEPLRRTPLEVSSSPEVGMSSSVKSVANSNTWLRSSMRRLRRLRLPNEDPGTSPLDLVIDPVQATPDPLIVMSAIAETVRPVSAPSRLTETRNISSRTSNRSSRPVSRLSGVSHEPSGRRGRSSSASSRSRRHRSVSSSGSSVASSVETTASVNLGNSLTVQNDQNQGSTDNLGRPCERNGHNEMPEAESPLGQWPHSLSSMMACLSCTLGLFNISRFASLTVHFGANFIFQFLILSMVFGLPFFCLQMCLGQQLGAGVIDMWRISPLFQGVGVSLLLAQALMGLYSIIGVSWMFVFFRDSFITKMDKYRWAEPFIFYRDDIQIPVNGTYKLSETVPDYFNGVVLQRHHLATGSEYGTIKFQLAFNLAVVWMIVFVSLSKGLRSYGKVIYVFTLLPVFGTFVLCAKILGMMPPEFVNIIFPETSWSEFFLNSRSWLAAAQETFLTWALLGAAVMQISSHNKHKHLLQRDSSLVAVITFTILLLIAFLANTCVQILRAYGYTYIPSSFEHMGSYIFLRSVKEPLPANLGNTPVRSMTHNSFILGDKVVRPGSDHTMESGYQVLRLATELIPATFAVLGSEQISPFWAVLFYFILILFGIAQQLAIWHCVITGIMAIKAKTLKSWETTITFFSCACGFLLGLPMATELGIYVIFFMDYIMGGIWWLIMLFLLQIVAVFMVRGRPYSGDNVVNAIFTQNNHPCVLSWAPALLSFTWNVVLPVGMMVLCITTFRNGNFREMFIWHHVPIAEYWPLWSRQIGSLLQLLPIICVPLVAVIQSYRYLNNGPNDILERIQLLYRPPIGEHMDDLAVQEAQGANSNNDTTNLPTNVISEDPPPKYTPPPSYTTATGARIAKFLRQSIRRSVRRLATVLGESSNVRHRGAIPQTQTQPPPPDYNAVLVEMNRSISSTDTTISMVDGTVSVPPVPGIKSLNSRLSTLERLRNIQPNPGSSIITAAEVASILRNSFRRSTVRRGANRRNINMTDNFHDNSIASMSAENLVDSAAPIGETSLVLDSLSDSLHKESKSTDNFSSVI